MKKEYKQNKVNLLANNLRINCPDLSNVFMCPVCLAEINKDKLSQISEAHIIPKAAKGNVKTFLCVNEL